MDKPATGSAHLGIVISLGAVAIVAYALSLPAHFAETTHRWPFPMGFAKLFFLGTFGELIKFRFAKGNWRLDRLLHRAAVWGVFGLWFTLAFAGFSALVDGVVRAGLWPADVAVVPAGLWLAFSKSLWINLLGMFGWGMMVVHEYCNHLIRTNWRGVEPGWVCDERRYALSVGVSAEDAAVLDPGAYVHVCDAGGLAGVHRGNAGGCAGFPAERRPAVVGGAKGVRFPRLGGAGMVGPWPCQKVTSWARGRA